MTISITSSSSSSHNHSHHHHHHHHHNNNNNNNNNNNIIIIIIIITITSPHHHHHPPGCVLCWVRCSVPAAATPPSAGRGAKRKSADGNTSTARSGRRRSAEQRCVGADGRGDALFGRLAVCVWAGMIWGKEWKASKRKVWIWTSKYGIRNCFSLSSSSSS